MTRTITSAREEVDRWRALPNPNDWRVIPETARLLQHWRNHPFTGIRPFFCQIEAVETAIWLTEVAPGAGKSGQRFIEHLANANLDANPEMSVLSPEKIDAKLDRMIVLVLEQQSHRSR